MSFYDTYGNYHLNKNIESFTDNLHGLDYCDSIDFYKNCPIEKRDCLIDNNNNPKEGENKQVTCAGCMIAPELSFDYKNIQCNSTLDGKSRKLPKGDWE